MSRLIYLICPVRNATLDQLSSMQRYVEKLESEGCQVHFPPRDVDQSNDDGGVRICHEHLSAMMGVDEVHVWWDNHSTGSHFDLGMAFMLDAMRRLIRLKFAQHSPHPRASLNYLEVRGVSIKQPIKFVIANPEEVPPSEAKSFTNVLLSLTRE